MPNAICRHVMVVSKTCHVQNLTWFCWGKPSSASAINFVCMGVYPQPWPSQTSFLYSEDTVLIGASTDGRTIALPWCHHALCGVTCVSWDRGSEHEYGGIFTNPAFLTHNDRYFVHSYHSLLFNLPYDMSLSCVICCSPFLYYNYGRMTQCTQL